jgi:hypothetical protein
MMNFPTLFDLFEAVGADTTSNPAARQAILDSLEPVLHSLGPDVLGFRYGWPSYELASKYIAFEASGISETDKDLLLNTLVLPEFTSRVARGVSNPMMDLWICCDEAQRLVSGANVATLQSTAIPDLIPQVRGTGIGLDLSVVSTGGLLRIVPSSCATKVMGRCGSAEDYASAGRDMGLTAEQIQWAQLHLVPGTFIGQVGEGDWRHPFVFRVPKMNLPATAPESSSPEGIHRLLELPVTRSEENRG